MFTPINEAVGRALDGQFASSREIHRRVDCWAQGGVRSVLNELVRAGRVETKLVTDRWQRPVRLYRRARAA